jgi:hypothetical protein
MLTTNTDGIGGSLPTVLNQQASEEKGEQARLSAFVGAIAVADLVKSTLGPKGMVIKSLKIQIFLQKRNLKSFS